MIFRALDTKAINNIKGNSNNVPFLPGGFDKEMDDLFSFSKREKAEIDDEEDKFIDFMGI